MTKKTKRTLFKTNRKCLNERRIHNEEDWQNCLFVLILCFTVTTFVLAVGSEQKLVIIGHDNSDYASQTNFTYGGISGYLYSNCQATYGRGEIDYDMTGPTRKVNVTYAYQDGNHASAYTQTGTASSNNSTASKTVYKTNSAYGTTKFADTWAYGYIDDYYIGFVHTNYTYFD